MQKCTQLDVVSLKIKDPMDVMLHNRNPNTQEAVAGRSWVPGQPGLHNETLSGKNKTGPGASVSCL
jgi:hypothetical protein